MPTQVDVPTGVGSPESWWFEGAASKIAAVAADDGDGSFIYADSGGALKHIQFTFPLVAGVGDPVTSASISASVRVYRYGQYQDNEFYMVWNSALGSNLYSSLFPNYSLVTRTTAAATLAAVNGQHGLAMRGWGGPGNKTEIWATHVYRSVTYSYAASGTDDGPFANLVASLIGAIGAGLLLREMPALAREVFRRTRVLILPHEYETAWRQIRHATF